MSALNSSVGSKLLSELCELQSVEDTALVTYLARASVAGITR